LPVSLGPRRLVIPIRSHVDLVVAGPAFGADHTAFGMTIFRDLILSVCIAIGFIVAVDSLMWLWDLGANGKLVAP
jgi:hypothetical protein